jgi:trans-aconitate 2-methyltransferase
MIPTPNESKGSVAEWDARAYHDKSRPHVAWGATVLERLSLRGDEIALDAGCGTGKLTAQLLRRLPQGKVIALDRSQNMMDQAKDFLGREFLERVSFVKTDLLDIDLDREVDVIFSTATFHWVLDHPRLFRNLFRALRPGGSLIAQCGGGPNLANFFKRTASILETPPYAPLFTDWVTPFYFADPTTTNTRLKAAGFVETETNLQSAPTEFANADEYSAFIETVILRDQLSRIPDKAQREHLLRELTNHAAGDDPPWCLDYWRLNISARRPENCDS